MKRDSKIYVAGHQGLVGSALVRRLEVEGYDNLILRTHTQLDLTKQHDVEAFFRDESPEYVFLAAAKVGGIWANNSYPAEFIYSNLAIQTNVLHAAWKEGIKRLLFLGSSCVYPRECPQPMREEYLLTGPMEPTNEPYAVAKIAGIIQCEAYNRQYGTRFISVMPTNLYGPHDNFDLENSHVLPALIRKFHLAKSAENADWRGIEKDQAQYGMIPQDILENLIAIAQSRGHEVSSFFQDKLQNSESFEGITLWGSGNPRREFLFVDDLADACFFLMNLPDDQYDNLLFTLSNPKSPAQHSHQDKEQPSFKRTMPLINIGCGEDHTIRELAVIVAEVLNYKGDLLWDESKPDGFPQKLLDVSKLNRLGWKHKISLKDGIHTTYNWYMGQLNSK